jgi:hypothetical protein
MMSEVEMAKNFNYSIAEELDKGLYQLSDKSMAKLPSTKKISDEAIYVLVCSFCSG